MKCPLCIGLGYCGEANKCPTCEGTGEVPSELRFMRPKALVKGPIRCHRCNISYPDATTYLSHNCKNPRLSDSTHPRGTLLEESGSDRCPAPTRVSTS